MMKKQPIHDGNNPLYPRVFEDGRTYRGSDSKCSRKILQLTDGWNRNENDPSYGDYPDDDLVLTFRVVRNKR